MTILPNLFPEIYVPAFELKVGGRPVPPAVAKSVMQITVTEAFDPPAHFSIQFYDRDLELTEPQGGLFTEGAQVEISLGYAGRVQRMLLGEINAVAVDFPEDGPPTGTVDGFDLYHRLTRGTCFRRFEGPTPGSGLPDSQVASAIAAEVKLTPSVEPTPPRQEATVQDNVSNAELLDQLAQRSDRQVWVDGQTLHFRARRPAGDLVTLEWGRTLRRFSPRLSVAEHVSAFEVHGWDPARKQDISYRAQAAPKDRMLAPAAMTLIGRGAGGSSLRLLTDRLVSSPQDARALAEAQLRDQQAGLIEGSGSCLGNPTIRVGMLLELESVGRFGGRYEVRQVTHSFGSGGYQTEFQVRSQP